MKLITTGITRIVITTEHYAIKFPRINYGWMKFIEGIHSNLSEADCWKAMKDETLLCPVLFSLGGFILVMPKVQVCRLTSVIPKDSVNHNTDVKPENYGWYKHNVVAIDYPYYRIKKHLR